MKRLLSLLVVGLALAINACTTPLSPGLTSADRTSVGADKPLLILISIDGFRADYLGRGHTPHIKGLADAGTTGIMRPSFPSLTFPNHYTLVTGLRPDHHGIVGNTMRDPRRPEQRFTLSNLEAVTDAFWWNDGTPFWVSAERAGVRTGVYFWPGSEADIQGVRPSLYVRYDKEVTASQRVDNLLAWIDLPEAERPEAYTLYFDRVDTQGHDFGPDSAEVNAALVETDAAIGRLLAGLETRGLKGKVNIVIVADHGMAAHDATRFVYLKDILIDGTYTVMGGQVAGITPVAGHEAEIESRLLRPHDHMRCWKKSRIPARFHYGSHARIPPIVCLADVGGYIISPSADNWTPKVPGGSHGYDPYAREMRALFVAAGPDFRAGTTLPTFDNVDVYFLLMRLLGLPPEPGDGSDAVFLPALANSAQTR